MNTDKIVDFLINEDKILKLFTIVFSVIYFSAFSILLKKIRERRIVRKKTFMETLINGISDNTIENINDLLNVYSGITRLSTVDLNNKQDLNKWLREILAKIINKEVGKEFTVEKVKFTRDKLTDFINANEAISPNTDLPEMERNIINDIITFNKLEDRDSVTRKVSELSSVIITRHEQQKKIVNLNKWSIPLAIIGLVLTIVFGLISILPR